MMSSLHDLHKMNAGRVDRVSVSLHVLTQELLGGF
jgi:hypothetical protein